MVSTIAIFPTAILYATGASLAFFGYKKGIKHSYRKIKKPWKVRLMVGNTPSLEQPYSTLSMLLVLRYRL